MTPSQHLRRSLATISLCIALGAPAFGSAPPPDHRSAPNVVNVHKDEAGFKLLVDGRPFMVFGMNWDYIPVGENYRYDLWRQPDAFIEAALDREMGLMKAMGVNTLRLFPGIPPRWVAYIYRKYGIHTVMNHTTGRYGFEVGGTYVSPVDYSDASFREAVRADIRRVVERYKDTPGIIMWMLGNENNYGLEWSSYEIEALPAGEQQAARAVHLYSLWGEIVADIKAFDTTKPVGIANGDLQYIDLIAEHVKGLDIMGSNVYRGPTSRDLFDVVSQKLGIPFLYTEFGADAYNARENREDQVNQARINTALWQEIYEMSHGKGRAGNAIGGLHFQWSDGWWKYLQDTNLSTQETNASWPNEAYQYDYVKGRNNMNEEWFGIAAKGPNDEAGLMPLYPRASYHVLREGFRLDPYAATTTLDEIRRHWAGIRVEDHTAAYDQARLGAKVQALERFRINEVRLGFDTFSTGGSLLDDPDRMRDRFDHLESFYVDVGFSPTTTLTGNLRLNVIGNVPGNPIDEIFYERRGRARVLVDEAGEQVVMRDLERIHVHEAAVTWEEKSFKLEAFFRKGHYHWGYDGDFFGLFPEAYYGLAIDTYFADAPFGFIFTGKDELDGFKLAFGPQLYWGANPQVIGSYGRTFGKVRLTLIHHEDLIRQDLVLAATNAVPEQLNRRTTLHAVTKFGPLKFEAGAMMSGTPRVGRRFLIAEEARGASWLSSGYRIQEDNVAFGDTLGGKLKLTYEHDGVRWYLQGAYKGLVADGGGDATVTFTGWRLKEDGRGNHWNVLAGTAFNIGNLQIAPNVLYQRPLVGPLPFIEDHYDVADGVYYPTIKGRNILEDPFVVRGNREQLAAEIMMTWDPTPGTWLWAWDNEIVEDAPIALSASFVYRHLPTIMDGAVGRLADGTAFGFATSAPAHDLWEAQIRAIMNPGDSLRLIGEVYAGTGQANGDSARLVTRLGTNWRLAWHRLAAQFTFRLNDWGPYDYHRDFNFTFPVQVMGDVSYGLTAPEWLGGLYTRFGLRFTYRTLDEFSNRFSADLDRPELLGNEWEARTYFHVAL